MEILEKKQEISLKKHSSLIAISNKELTIPQRKLYNAILYLAAKKRNENPEMNTFKIRFSEIVKFSGYSGFTNKMYLKDSVRSLVDTSIDFNLLQKDKVNIWGAFSLLSQVIAEEHDEYIIVEFPSIILTNLTYPSIYALLNLSIINSLSTKYGLGLYELLTDYKKINNLKMEIAKLRTILGVNPDDYLRFNHFKDKVLQVSINEINEKTDLEVSYVLERTGRSYTHITFIIKEKYLKLDEVESSAFHLLRSKGLSDLQANRFAKAMKKSTILECVNILEGALKRGTVKSSVAYLTKILSHHLEKEIEITSYSTPFKSPVEELDKELEAQVKKQAIRIVSESPEKYIDEFLNQLSDFAIEHLKEKNILNKDGELIDNSALLNHYMFTGWVQNKYVDYETERKIHSKLKKKDERR